MIEKAYKGDVIMTTLADVANEANVSKMTVSRVINHPDQVTDELKALVFQAMQKLNYRPNIAAKALASNKTQVIKLFILEEMSNVEPHYMNLMMGLSRALSQKQYSLQLMTNKNFDIGGCDGYVITGMRDKDYEWIGRLEKPVVLYGENNYGYDFVDINNQAGGELATNYALSCGYQRIVFVGINLREPFEYSRERGYLKVMQQHLLEPEIVRINNHSHTSEAKISQLWEKYPKKTVFVCASDRLAVGVERAIQNKGGKIPEDYGVIGYDGVFLDKVASPQLTTIKQDIVNLGEICGEMLLKKISQKGQKQGFKLIEPTLIKRGTT